MVLEAITMSGFSYNIIGPTTNSNYPQETFRSTTFSESFWALRREIVHKNTLHRQLKILRATGRYDAFRLKWHPTYEDGYKALFWDSDVAKWLEGACYFLAENRGDESDEEIDRAVQELTHMISSAQWDDGYLNIHFTVVKPGHRFTNLRDLHELYNAGHLIEAALSHEQHYKNGLLIGPMLKYVDLLHRTFGPGGGQIHGYPGHPEIELALLRLYARTSNIKAYELAKFFITERGNPTGAQGKHFYITEAAQRGDAPGQRPAGDAWPTANAFWYQQAHKPLLEQETIEGHSVRAMYLLTAVADLVRHARTVEHDSKIFAGYQIVCERLWNNMVNKRMYLTGGIGSISQWEGFGIDYFLPQSTDEGGCYAETCASIGIMMLAERMLQLDLDGKYANIMELALYNTVLGGMSQDGKEFLYENHLASCPERPSKREDWFDCACCPPNITRTIGMLGGYIWSYDSDGKNVLISIHLYNTAELAFSVGSERVTLKQTTRWPWTSIVHLELDAPSDLNVTIKFRVPSWARAFKNGDLVDVSPKPLHDISPQKSYVTLSADYTRTNLRSTLEILFNPASFKPRFLRQHPSTNQNTVTIARGPLIYCAEDVDNVWVDDHFKSIRISPDAQLEDKPAFDPVLNEHYIAVSAPGSKVDYAGYDLLNGSFPGIRADQTKDSTQNVEVIFIPYYYRGNRGGKGHMRVGFKVAGSNF